MRNTSMLYASAALIMLTVASYSDALGANTSTIEVSVEGDGSVSSSPSGIECPQVCSGDYSKSEIVVLQARPALGQTFLGWAGSCAGVEETCSLKANKNALVVATFTQGEIAPPAPVPKTGQMNCYDATGAKISCSGTSQDGDIRAGTAWPTPRFSILGDGTARDDLTGLVWLQDGLCLSGNWQAALDRVAAVSDGSCGLTDGSAPGQWRMPNAKEMLSLVDYGTGSLPSPHPFTNLPNSGLTYGAWFWTSTTDVFNTDLAWVVLLGSWNSNSGTPGVRAVSKSLSSNFVLIVRDP